MKRIYPFHVDLHHVKPLNWIISPCNDLLLIKSSFINMYIWCLTFIKGLIETCLVWEKLCLEDLVFKILQLRYFSFQVLAHDELPSCMSNVYSFYKIAVLRNYLFLQADRQKDMMIPIFIPSWLGFQEV